MGETKMLMTERCELMAISEKDYESILMLYMDEDVRKYLDGTVDEISFGIRFQMMLESNHYWTVRLKETNEFIGLVCLDTGHDRINTEIGYQFLPAFWGKGYAKEVIEKVIEYGFHSLELTTIIAETPTLNERACRLLKRVGMKFEKTMKRFGSDQYMFSIQKGAKHRVNRLVYK
ncbi:GNAT family N-acetyltransferase [Neobacillus drentensis]|uniref:GNAT family N-acetyltransferase n=1 Tax=Neobacillus drentensis TaxID=220684 RepID=UPI002FFF6EF5